MSEKKQVVSGRTSKDESTSELKFHQSDIRNEAEGSGVESSWLWMMKHRLS